MLFLGPLSSISDNAQESCSNVEAQMFFPLDLAIVPIHCNTFLHSPKHDAILSKLAFTKCIHKMLNYTHIVINANATWRCISDLLQCSTPMAKRSFDRIPLAL
jgi:hypothetical protein